MTDLSLFNPVPNQFKENLKNGVFSILTEVETPSLDQEFELAVTPILNALKATADRSEISSTFFLDRVKGELSREPSSLIPLARESALKTPIVVLSGKGSSLERIKTLVHESGVDHCANFLAVTGHRSDLHKGTKPYKNGYIDSLDILDYVKQIKPNAFLGATVNPFKYSAQEVYPQYGKLVKKIKAGAEYIVTQSGWDMAKFQELIWFVTRRELDVPMVARVLLPSLKDIKGIGEGDRPGLQTSKVFAAVIERESKVNYEQALAANIIRIALVVVGCRLLGYSAVSLQGVDSDRLIKMVLKKIDEFTQELKTWEEWHGAWKRFHGDIRFAPEGNDFYLFDGLLAEKSNNWQAHHSINIPPSVEVDKNKKIRYYISKLFSVDKSNGFVRGTLKHLMYHSNNCDRAVSYLPVDKCPKGLTRGTCGSSYPGGECEFKHGACLFSRHFEIINWLKKLDKLED